MNNDLSLELARLAEPPLPPAPLGLVTLDIQPYGSLAEYADRLVELISAAVNIAKRSDFCADILPEGRLPSWFKDGILGDPCSGVHTLKGIESYFLSRPTESPWDVQEWLSCFDPRLRRWSWWDLTQGEAGVVSLWVDTNGEPVVPMEELWFAVFASGAKNVAGPLMKTGQEWVARRMSAR